MNLFQLESQLILEQADAIVQRIPNDYQGILAAKKREYQNGTVIITLDYVTEGGETVTVLVDLTNEAIFEGTLEEKAVPTNQNEK